MDKDNVDDFNVIAAIQVHLANYLELMAMLNNKDLKEEDIAKIIRSATLAATGGTFLTQIALLNYVQISAQNAIREVLNNAQTDTSEPPEDDSFSALGDMWR